MCFIHTPYIYSLFHKVEEGEVALTTGKRTLWGLTRPPELQNTETARRLFGIPLVKPIARRSTRSP